MSRVETKWEQCHAAKDLEDDIPIIEVVTRL